MSSHVLVSRLVPRLVPRLVTALLLGLALGCSRSDARFAGKQAAISAATVNAAALPEPSPLPTFESLLAEGNGPEVFRTDIVVEADTVYRTPALDRDTCLNVIGAVTSSEMRIAIDGPDLVAPHVEPGATFRIPGSTCARAGETIAIAIRGRGTARVIFTAPSQ